MPVLIGKTVKHNRFGEGVVKAVASGLITVQFKSGDRSFQIPDAFSRFLAFTDAGLQGEMLLWIKDKKAGNEEKWAEYLVESGVEIEEKEPVVFEIDPSINTGFKKTVEVPAEAPQAEEILPEESEMTAPDPQAETVEISPEESEEIASEVPAEAVAETPAEPPEAEILPEAPTEPSEIPVEAEAEILPETPEEAIPAEPVVKSQAEILSEPALEPAPLIEISPEDAPPPPRLRIRKRRL